ncbi:hypothetical protein BH11MYX1_BH11MYX1_38540 [soil metagenome]
MRGSAALWLVALPAIASCRIDLDHHSYNDAPPSGRVCSETSPPAASCTAAVGHMELSWIQTNILTPKCALSDSCHTNVNPQDGLDLSTAAKSYTLLVNATSKLDTSRKLVVPGDVNASLLSAIIGVIKPDEASPSMTELPKGLNGDVVGTMPYNGQTMCCEKADAISAWITAGAANN